MELVYLLLRGIHTVQQTLQCDNPKTLFFFPAAELFLVGWIVSHKKMYHIYDAQKMKMAFGYQKWQMFMLQFTFQIETKWVCIFIIYIIGSVL